MATELINPDLLAQLTHSLSIQFPFLDFEIDNIDIINANINSIGDEWNNKFDTVIMNPPFGTKHNKGLDMIFLQRAIKMASTAVYSLHKTSTRAHIAKVAASELQMEAQVLAELRYDLPKTMSFHKKKSVDVEVDLWRFEVSDGSRAAALASLVGGLGLGAG